MIDSITVEGFKSIASTKELALGPINLLIGPNGSGKSNFIEVFSFLQAIRIGRLQEYVKRAGGADRILHFGSETTNRVHIHVSLESRQLQYRLTLIATDDDALRPNLEAVYLTEQPSHPSLHEQALSGRSGEAGISLQYVPGHAEDVRRSIDSWRLFHFHDTGSASSMRKTADVNDNRYLRSNASNLAAFLYFLSLKHETAYNMIRRTVRLAAPFFDDFVLQPLALNETRIRLEWRHRGSDAYFDVASFSDGTLRFIALATLLLQPDSLRPQFVVIDEPELGLHPYAITLFASLVKQVSAKTQVILATQSSLLLDHFQPEEVLVADRVHGQTQFRRLDADKLDNWLTDYSLGQLWEKNEIGGRPSHE